jgi:hypothetical protein
MSWPTPQDYNEAVQSPHICFSDLELQNGTPTVTALGLPKPISGAFASVYQITCGSRVWAVRCFLTEFVDQEQRYQAISEHLRRSNLPSTVAFQFLRRGVLVRGAWYPALKMEWVGGEPLNSYIERNLSRPDALQSLARQWVQVLSCLRREQIAHGDLQHGNILVNDGQIKLIDYDGLFVPALRGFTSHEQGHRNYQHPARAGKDYGPYLDAFPGWVILVSLSALAVDPHLWKTLNGGDECLLFRREDFDRPGQSRAFHAMARSRSPEVRALGSYMQSLLPLPLAQIPPVDATQRATASVQPVSTAGIPDWLEHNRRKGLDLPLPPAAVDRRIVPPSGGVGADWLVDHLAGNTTVVSIWQGVSFFADRLVLLSAWIATFTIVIFGVVAGLPLAVPGFVLVLALGAQAAFLAARYRALPCHASRRAAASALSRSRDRVAAIEQAMQEVKLEIDRLREPLRDVQSQYQQLLVRFNNARGDVAVRHRDSISENERMVAGADGREADAIRIAEHRHQQQATDLAQQQNQLESQEQNELYESLNAARDSHIQSCMADKSIAGARFSGIGGMLKARLQAAGIRSAVDVTYWNVRRVQGIGAAKAALILDWAQSERRLADASAPKSLAPDAHRRIVDKYAHARKSLGWQIDGLGRRAIEEKQAIYDKYARERRELGTARTRIEADNEREAESLRVRFETEKQILSGRFDSLTREIAKVRQMKEQEQQDRSRALFQAKIRMSRTERDVMRHEHLSFAYYVRHVVRFRRG